MTQNNSNLKENEKKDWQIGILSEDMIEREIQDNAESEVVNEMYIGSKSTLRNLKQKNNVYSRDTITSKDNVDVDGYEKIKEQIRREYQKEKEEKVRGKSLEISRISNADKSVNTFFEGKNKILGELKNDDMDSLREQKNEIIEAGSNMLEDLGDTNFNFKSSGSLLSLENNGVASLKKSEVVSIRDELRSRKLEMIEERQSEEERIKIGVRTEREFTKGQYGSNLTRVKSENLFSRRFNLRNQEDPGLSIGARVTSQEKKPEIYQGLPASKSSINYRRKEVVYNLDESSKIYSGFYDTNDQGMEGRKNETIPAYKYHDLLSRFNNLEIEKGELLKENGELKNEVSELIQRIKEIEKENLVRGNQGVQDLGYHRLEERAKKLKMENDKLQKQLFQMNMKKFNEMQMGDSNRGQKKDIFRSFDQRNMKMSRSKSRGRNFVASEGVVNPFNEENYFNLQREKVRTERSNNREVSKKIKFADSVVTMVGGLIQSKGKVNLKMTWHMLKKVLKEYFKMKKNPPPRGYEGNLPTAVKDNRIYGDLTKNQNIQGYNSERIENKFRNDLRGASPQNGTMSYRVEDFRGQRGLNKLEQDAKYMDYMNIRKDR